LIDRNWLPSLVSSLVLMNLRTQLISLMRSMDLVRLESTHLKKEDDGQERRQRLCQHSLASISPMFPI
jgi:hypothetical protein